MIAGWAEAAADHSGRGLRGHSGGEVHRRHPAQAGLPALVRGLRRGGRGCGAVLQHVRGRGLRALRGHEHDVAAVGRGVPCADGLHGPVESHVCLAADARQPVAGLV